MSLPMASKNKRWVWMLAASHAINSYAVEVVKSRSCTRHAGTFFERASWERDTDLQRHRREILLYWAGLPD